MSILSENEKILEPLDDFNLDGESLYNEYPPAWHDDNKLFIYFLRRR